MTELLDPEFLKVWGMFFGLSVAVIAAWWFAS